MDKQAGPSPTAMQTLKVDQDLNSSCEGPEGTCECFGEGQCARLLLIITVIVPYLFISRHK